jgi:ankyrin repeat protein
LRGHTSVVELLLNKGANCEGHVKNDGDSSVAAPHDIWPLYIAARQGIDSCVKILLEKGAAVDRHRDDGTTALHVASEAGSVACVQSLLAAKASVLAMTAMGVCPLLVAATACARPEVTELLLSAGAEVDALSDDTGITALLGACMEGHVGVAEKLLAAGGDPRRRTREGKSAHELATRYGHVECVQLLEDALKASTTRKVSYAPE